MGVVCRRDHVVSLRVGCIVRSAALRCSPVEIEQIPTTRPLRPRRKVLSHKDANRRSALSRCTREDPTYFATVQGALFSIPRSFFEKMSIESRQKLVNSPGKGEIKDNPIALPGLTIPQFRSLFAAYTVHPTFDLNRLSLDQILSISEWAYNLGLSDLKSWAVQTMVSLFVPADTPLRTASNETFLRALRLAILYRRPDISSSIQVKWLTRILWHELSPLPAILFADKYDFRSLLSHAYYTHMVDLGGRLTNSAFLADSSSILNRRQKTHILAGHLSLSTYWKRLRMTPPSFQQAPQCNLHRQCCAAWKMRWSVACSRPCAISDADVLRRLRCIEDVLKEDVLLKVCLARTSALESISRKRTEISNHLHHHFDLS